MKRMLFIHMPLAVPAVPSLAIELLAAILERHGVACDTFYGTTRLRRTPAIESFIHSLPGEVIFTPQCFRHLSKERVARSAVDCRASALELQSNYEWFGREAASGRQPRADAWPVARRQVTDEWPFGTPFDALLADLLTHMDLAEDCIERCLADIPAGRYDVYAFSVSFDSQKMASLALARRLKEREPGARVVFGGTACDGEMGHEILKRFEFVDVVGQGDADLTIAPLVLALRGETSLSSVPGIVYRDGGGRVRATPPAPPLPQLDALPVPDYGRFLEQLAASDWSGEEPFILYEASRGCWWGERHHCKFCGLRADGLAYRRKSARRTRDELEELASRYPVHRVLYATDAILDHRYLKEFFPTLPELRERHGWKLFFEIKSNLRKGEVALLAGAGVDTVQPGIESFSDHVLQLMDKGSAGIRQVQALKWLTAYKINVIYNFIIGTPGETADDYEEMLELIPLLTHLPPPRGVNLLSLDRFSPYFREPARYGLTEVAPEAAYSVIYPDPSIDLSRLAYKFQYRAREHEDPLLLDAWERLRSAVVRWGEERKGRRLWLVGRESGVKLVEYRDGKRSVFPLDGGAAELYRFCDGARSFAEIGRAFPEVAEQALRACLAAWAARGWVYHSRTDYYLSLAVEANPPAHGAWTKEPSRAESLAAA